MATGHVTTQTLCDEKTSFGREGWQSVLIVAVVNFCGFQNLLQSLKNYPLYRVFMRYFAD